MTEISREAAEELGFLKPVKKRAKKGAKKKEKEEAKVVDALVKSSDSRGSELSKGGEKKALAHLLEKLDCKPVEILAQIAMFGESEANRLKAAESLADREGSHLRKKAVENTHTGKIEFHLNIQGEYKDEPKKIEKPVDIESEEVND